MTKKKNTNKRKKREEMTRENEKLTGYSSATASDLHRLPYSARASASGHPMTTVDIWLNYSVDNLL
jgi:hypothetical protein